MNGAVGFLSPFEFNNLEERTFSVEERILLVRCFLSFDPWIVNLVWSELSNSYEAFHWCRVFSLWRFI